MGKKRSRKRHHILLHAAFDVITTDYSGNPHIGAVCSILNNMQEKNKEESRKIVNAARKAMVSAKKHVETVKEKASEFTRKAETSWEETKPHRKEAKEELKKAVQQGVDVGKEVKENFESR